MIISGSIENIVYRNSENGYTILALKTKGGIVTATGKFPIVGKGEVLELQGEFKINKMYGEQFVAESVKVDKPTDTASIEKYLSCGLISGVGEVTARNIVKMFGEETLKIIDEQPKLLAQVRGISLKKANEIHSTYQDIKKMQDAVMFLQKYDISINMSVKIFNKYKYRTEEVLMDNPYRLVEDIEGIGFKTADKIAMKLGVAFDSNIRVRAGVLYALSEIAEKQGSTIAYREELVAATLEVLELDDGSLELLENMLTDLEISGAIRKVVHNDKEAYAIAKYYSMESFIARKLTNLCDSASVVKYGTEEEIGQYEILNNITLHEAEDVRSALSRGLALNRGAGYLRTLSD